MFYRAYTFFDNRDEAFHFKNVFMSGSSIENSAKKMTKRFKLLIHKRVANDKTTRCIQIN